MIEINEFRDKFLKYIYIAMAEQGRVLLDSEILVLNEFCKNIKSNGLVLIGKEELRRLLKDE